jgi:hypothetical protein
MLLIPYGYCMYVISALRRSLLLGVAALIAVIALIAWTSHTRKEPAAVASNPVTGANPAPTPPPMNAYGEPVPANAGASLPPAQPPSVPANAGPRAPVPVVHGARARVRRAVAPAPAGRRHYRRTRARRRVVVVRRRPLRRSAEIVGGSAAGGALVGGLAGGGKGAGIGALVGGAGGLVYDRLTHKKKVVVQR